MRKDLYARVCLREIEGEETSEIKDQCLVGSSIVSVVSVILEYSARSSIGIEAHSVLAGSARSAHLIFTLISSVLGRMRGEDDCPQRKTESASDGVESVVVYAFVLLGIPTTMQPAA
ncbi:hypothetical protein PMAYCL1PPCAC_29834, partial [Pristionchus mayeri]